MEMFMFKKPTFVFLHSNCFNHGHVNTWIMSYFEHMRSQHREPIFNTAVNKSSPLLKHC